MPCINGAAVTDQQHQPSRAMLFALACAVVLPFADVIIKILVDDYPVVMIAWVRMGLTTLMLGSLGAASMGPAILRPVARQRQVYRGLAIVLATTMIFIGFHRMPLAECTALVFIAPVLSNLFSRLWLNEPGDARTWIIAVISFLGVLLIAKPGTALFSPDAVFPLIGAIGLAAFLTLSRAVAPHDKPQLTSFYGPFIACIAFTLALPWFWVTPQSWEHIGMFLAVGVLASLGTYLQTLAYRYGSTHVVAPFSYTSIVVATMLGWMVFEALPDYWSIAGMVVIAAAGMAMVIGQRPVTGPNNHD